MSDEIRTFRTPRKKLKKSRHTSLSYILLSNSEPVGQCWLWKGSANLRGYGEMGFGGRSTMTHIFAYNEWRGEIPKGMTIDHICKNKLCINPDHLHITSRINNRIIGGKKYLICLKGHNIKYPNVVPCYFRKGKNICKKCQNESKMIHGYYYA